MEFRIGSLPQYQEVFPAPSPPHPRYRALPLDIVLNQSGGPRSSWTLSLRAGPFAPFLLQDADCMPRSPSHSFPSSFPSSAMSKPRHAVAVAGTTQEIRGPHGGGGIARGGGTGGQRPSRRRQRRRRPRPLTAAVAAKEAAPSYLFFLNTGTPPSPPG